MKIPFEDGHPAPNGVQLYPLAPADDAAPETPPALFVQNAAGKVFSVGGLTLLDPQPTLPGSE